MLRICSCYSEIHKYILVQYICRYYKVLFCICHVKSINCMLYSTISTFSVILYCILYKCFIFILYIYINMFEQCFISSAIQSLRINQPTLKNISPTFIPTNGIITPKRNTIRNDCTLPCN